MTTLPTGIPRLDATIREEAERLARELADRPQIGGEWRDLVAVVWAPYFESLLRDLRRPASRDWASRALAGVVGMECGATAPEWYWVPADPGNHDADGWPAGWWLSNGLGDMRFFSADDWCPDDHTHVPDIPRGTENAAAALVAVLVHVCRQEPTP